MWKIDWWLKKKGLIRNFINRENILISTSNLITAILFILLDKNVNKEYA